MLPNLNIWYQLIQNIDACNDSVRFLVRANTESEWIYGQYIIWYIYVALLSIFLMYPISVVVWLRSGSSFDASLLFQMYHISWVIIGIRFILNHIIIWMHLSKYDQWNSRLPWNQQTPLGYVAEMCFHLFCCTTYCLSVSLIVLFISVTLYQRAFYEMFKYSSDQIEPSDAHMKTNICQMVKFHIFAKEFVTFIMSQIEITVNNNIFISTIVVHSSNQLKLLVLSSQPWCFV